MKVTTTEKAGIAYAIQCETIDRDDPAVEIVTIADILGMPDAEGCDTFEQYLARCKANGVEVVE